VRLVSCHALDQGRDPRVHPEELALVKVATTKAQRKLFFNLRSHKEGLDAMTPAQVEALAKTLDVKREEVIEMETRLSGRDIALESPTDDEDDKFAPIAYLSSDNSSRPA
jgi:RNA polymerase sigma-32 factor